MLQHQLTPENQEFLSGSSSEAQGTGRIMPGEKLGQILQFYIYVGKQTKILLCTRWFQATNDGPVMLPLPTGGLFSPVLESALKYVFASFLPHSGTSDILFSVDMPNLYVKPTKLLDAVVICSNELIGYTHAVHLFKTGSKSVKLFKICLLPRAQFLDTVIIGKIAPFFHVLSLFMQLRICPCACVCPKRKT